MSALCGRGEEVGIVGGVASGFVLQAGDWNTVRPGVRCEPRLNRPARNEPKAEQRRAEQALLPLSHRLVDNTNDPEKAKSLHFLRCSLFSCVPA
jgi:hypothetical protein